MPHNLAPHSLGVSAEFEQDARGNAAVLAHDPSKMCSVPM
jgi:hypothetical protein